MLKNLLLAAALAAATLAPGLAPPAAAAAVTQETYAKEMQGKLNAYRATRGLSALAVDPTLMRLALEHAAGNAQYEKLDHTRGGTIQQRLAAAGIRASAAGEADVRNQPNVDGAVAWWKASPVHNGIMLLQGVRRMGFACVVSKSGRTYWTLIVSS
jgi:uncharacterized protein YkwD